MPDDIASLDNTADNESTYTNDIYCPDGLGDIDVLKKVVKVDGLLLSDMIPGEIYVALPGSLVEFTLTVKNTGNDTVDVQVSDYFDPALWTFVSSSTL